MMALYAAVFRLRELPKVFLVCIVYLSQEKKASCTNISMRSSAFKTLEYISRTISCYHEICLEDFKKAL